MSAVFENRPEVGVEGPEKQGFGKSSPARKKSVKLQCGQTDRYSNLFINCVAASGCGANQQMAAQHIFT